MTVARGVTLGPYEILTHIGAGGMGDVWRARDKRLGRDVAVKVLPDSYAPGDDRVRRFEQEARAAGALNHPGLVTIFDVGTFEGAPYIVMELLEGETLRDAIGEAPPRPLPIRRAIDYAVQIAAALAVAHEKGIIHRDLKPENIFITTDGRVKILDFGLAKLAEDAREADARRTGRHLTSTGMVVGTPGYMSPEQVRAQPLDYRTDIFSLGSVLYEMLGGHRAFDRDTAVETMNAVLKEEPAPIATPLPPALEAIVHHCMEKSPRDRFQSARDLAFQLRMLPEFQNSRTDNLRAIPETDAEPAPSRVPMLIAAAVALLALAGIAFALYRVRGRAAVTAMPRTYKQLTFSDGLELYPTLAPDGKTFAYVSAQSGNRDIYVQRVDGRTATDITADSPDDDSEPAFSPDGSQIAFRSERDGGGIFVMGVTGESVRRLTDVGHNPAWSPDGTKLVIAEEKIEMRPQVRITDSELWLVDTRSGSKWAITSRKHFDAVQPSWSPNGKRIAFWGRTGGQRDIWTIDPNAPKPESTTVRVTNDAAVDWNPLWSPDGQHLYFGSDRDGTMNLWRIAIDEATGKTSGAPEPLSLPAAFSGLFSIAQNGDVTFVTLTRSYRLLAFPFDAASGQIGAPHVLFGGPQEILTFEVSPDKKSIAFTTGGPQEDLFVANVDGTRLRQLTNDAAKDRGPAWAADGKTIDFYSNREGSYQIWSIRADGGGLMRVTDAGDVKRIGGGQDVISPAIAPDGRTLAALADSFNVVAHLDRPLNARLEHIDSHFRGGLRWSPDGTRILGVSNDAHHLGVYSLQTRQSEWLIDHGRSPQWLADGKRFVFFEKNGMGIFDLQTRRASTIPVAPLPGVEWTSAALARDGSTVYARQTSELGDIWLVHFEK